jgi:hypothetical protein
VNGQRFTTRAPRTWTSSDSRTRSITPYLGNLMFLCEGPDEVVLPPVSASEFRWRLRDAALAAADRSGIDHAPVADMLSQFGASAPMLQVGGVVSNRLDIEALPVGSVVYSGHPSTPEVLSVWTRHEDQLRHTYGPDRQRENGQPVTIFSMPDPPQLLSEPVADPVTLAKIAVRAWRLGRIFQRKYSWCSVFDQTLLTLGINDAAVAPAGESVRGPGDTLDRAQTAMLPEGSLLWWSFRSRTGFAVYQRDDSARNKSRTRRVFGWEDNGEHSHDRMTVVQTPAEPMLWSLSGYWLARCPDGVQFKQHNTPDVAVLDAVTRADLKHWIGYDVTGWPA